ncbi:unnamed protein product [Tilletia controversa]|nr:unnamed protein product [Tilletia controversa]
MEDMDHRNEDPPVVRQVQMTLENGPRSAGSGVNNVTRVIHAKRVRVSKYEDESEPQRVVCARATKISMEDDSPALSPLEWERGGPTMADAYYTEDNSDRGSASDY